MTFTDKWNNHPIIIGCGLLIIGGGAGIAIKTFFYEPLYVPVKEVKERYMLKSEVDKDYVLRRDYDKLDKKLDSLEQAEKTDNKHKVLLEGKYNAERQELQSCNNKLSLKDSEITKISKEINQDINDLETCKRALADKGNVQLLECIKQHPPQNPTGEALITAKEECTRILNLVKQ
jgi:small-conductance mechanosensitive channel